MNIRRYLLLVLIISILYVPAEATFSIVAVDTVNNIVGGAGASCIDNSFIINDIIENIGAVHTQAWYLQENQQNAHSRLASGWTPQEIIDWLEANDAESSAAFRQYGIVTLAGSGASAAYSGAANSPWKGHLTGPGYSIQGNILLGPEIVDSMETMFLLTDGPLEEKLMAAMQAANVPGADTRCMSCDKPAISSFIKVVKPGDGPTPYLQIVVADTECDQNPTDSLQILYDAWIDAKYPDAAQSGISLTNRYLIANGRDTANFIILPRNSDGDFPREGATAEAISIFGIGTITPLVFDEYGEGYTGFYITTLNSGIDTLTATATAGGVTVDIDSREIIYAYPCADANSDFALNILDITYLIAYLYSGGNSPYPLGLGDANGSGLNSINILDITYMIAFLYSGGPDPVCE